MDKSNYLQPREYEMLAILIPDQPEEETKAAIDTMVAHITEQNGTIDSINADSPWGRRRLAYTIRHEGVDYRDGHYVLVYFTAMPSALTEIERDLKLDTNIIRYLLLINDPEMGEKIDEAQLAADAAAAEAEATSESEEAPAEATEEAAATEEVATEEAPAAEEASTEEAPAEEAEADAEVAETEEVAESEDEAAAEATEE